jgi:hypothetical protein
MTRFLKDVNTHTIIMALRAAAMVLCLVATQLLASAQAAPEPLPTAPGAGTKAGIGGYTAARASLPGDGGSPLEPYLFLFILAGGGIVAWGAALTTDYRLRATEARRSSCRRS